MSFVEQFRQQALPAFRHVYLRVAELERISKEQTGNPRTPSRPALRFLLEKTENRQKPIEEDTATSSGEGSVIFESALKSELDRVAKFMETYSEELWVRLGQALEVLDGFGSSLKSPKKRTVREDGLTEVDGECLELCESLIAMDEFRRQNVLAAAFLAQGHDAQLQEKKNKRTASTSAWQISPVYVKAIEQYLNEEGGMDPLLLGLSQAYSKIRKLRNRVQCEEGLWEPPDTFTRNTTKYWIHPADVLKVKCLVIKHLPVLIFGKRAMDVSAASKLAPLKQHTQREHALISSVYFDTDKLDTYHERLVREHGSSLVRIRWYGKESTDAEDKVFVERKVHKDGWTGEKSCKERAELLASEVMDFLRGSTTPSMHEDNPKTALLTELQSRILQRHEVPSVRTEYQRVAFQECSSNRVRISLDTRLRILKEFNSPKKNSEEWCRSLKFKVEDTDVVHFPYAVFEIKIQGDEPPDWVQDLIESGLIAEVPKFSKFLHGTAMLFGSKIRNSPSWFAPDEEGYVTPATIQEVADVTDVYAPRVAGFLFPPNIDKRENTSSECLSRQPMQVSTLCHVPDNHTVLSEVVVMQSGQQSADTSRRVVRTAVHGHPTRLQSTRQRSLSGGAGHNLELSVRKQEKSFRWKLPWKRESAHACTSPSATRAAALVRTRIEPKTFFANERTFLSWLTVAVMVMFMGLSLLDASTTTRSGLGLFGSGPRCRDSSNTPVHIVNNSTSGESTTVIHEANEGGGGLGCNAARISGALIAPMALILMVYSLYMYRKRSIQILRRESVRYDDQYGPVILTLLLVTVLFLAYVLSVS